MRKNASRTFYAETPVQHSSHSAQLPGTWATLHRVPAKPRTCEKIAGIADAGRPVTVEPEIPPLRSGSRAPCDPHGPRERARPKWQRGGPLSAGAGEWFHVTMPAHPVTVAACRVDAADTLTEPGERAYAASTFGTWIAAINHHQRATGHLSPSAHELVRGHCR